jgi:hypothetical protein
MKLRSLFLFLFYFISAVAFSQSQPLHWYMLKSAVAINAVEGKTILTEIRSVGDYSQSTFNDKSDIFSLASSVEVNMSELIQHLNTLGYFVADLTNGDIYENQNERTTIHFQQVLFLLADPENISKANYPIVLELTTNAFENLTASQQQSFLQLGGVILQKN